MRTLKFALAAVAAFAFSASAQTSPPVTGMGSRSVTPNIVPPNGLYQPAVVSGSGAVDNLAFHAGGVAACDGCHVMHNAQNGVAKSTTDGAGVAPWTNVTNMYLLQAVDQSSTCLICHSGAKDTSTNNLQFQVADFTSAVPTNRTPGGDFGWMDPKYNWSNSPNQRHGHNVAALDFNIDVDPQLTVAPGGTFAVGSGRAKFGCHSCHDPHGRYRYQLDAAAPNGVGIAGPFPGSPSTLPIAASGSYGQLPTGQYAVGVYRLLGGQYYAPASNAAYPFPNDPPVAIAPQTYNSSEATNEVRVSYGTGMSEWCQNCHTYIHLDGYTSGVTGLRHPAGSDAMFHAGQIQIYNTYVSSGHMEPANTANYTSLVPFEQGKDASLATLKTNTASNSIIAANSSSNVMCLSCHRAHASAFDSILRWDQNATFLTSGSAFLSGVTANGAVVRTPAMTQAGYYDRIVGVGGTAIGPYQRSLCNKCHGKD